MRRAVFLALALIAALFGLAVRSGAVPLLVELKIRDPLADNAQGSANEEVSILPGGKKGNGGEKGGKPDGYSKAELKALTLWLSTDGKSWKALEGEITGLSDKSISARFSAKGDGSPIDLASSFGLPTGDITGSALDSYYIGVSTGSTPGSGPTLSAQLVSWEYSTKGAEAGSVPEPAAWSLLGLGAIGIALAVRARRKG